MRFSLLLFIAVCTANCATSLSQFGITWTFDANYTTGQYANGDYYVVAPGGLTITNITPASLLVASRTNNDDANNSPKLNTYTNGSMVNPLVSSGKHGFDSGTTGYLASLNAARPNGNDLSVGNPLVLPAGSSLVSSISRTAVDRPALSAAAVLTVVSSAPAANSLRPPFCGTDKSGTWNLSQFNYSRLGSLASVSSEPSLSGAESDFAKFWLEFPFDDNGRYLHPLNQMPDYGADMAAKTTKAVNLLMSDFSNAEKQTLAIAIAQIGIDIYGAARTGANWRNNGGHGIGRKLPLLAAALLLEDSSMLAYCDAAQHFIFSEDQQTFIVDTAQLSVVPYTGDGRQRLPYKQGTVTYSGSDITWSGAHDFEEKQPIRFSGTLPPQLDSTKDYKILASGLTSNVFRVAQSGTTPISFTGSGTMTATMLNVPDWGEKHVGTKTRDGSNWDTYYRDIIYRQIMGMAVAAANLDGGAGRTHWNWEPFFLYCARIRNITADGGWGSWVNNLWYAYGYGDVPAAPPSAPTIGVITAPSSQSAVVNWTNNSTNETSFDITRANSSGGTYVPVATGVEAGSTSYIDQTVGALRTYYYKVVARNPSGTGTSAYGSVTTPGPTPSFSRAGTFNAVQ